MVKTRDGAGSAKQKKKASSSSPTISKPSSRIPSQPLDAVLRPRSARHVQLHTRSRSRQLGRRVPTPPLPPRRAPPSSRSRSPQQKPQSPATRSRRSLSQKPSSAPARRRSSRRSMSRSQAKDSVSGSSEEVFDDAEVNAGGESESSPEVAANIPTTSKKSTKAQSKTGGGGGGAANGVTSTATPTPGSPPRSKKVNGAMLSVMSLAQSKLPIVRLSRCKPPSRPVTRSLSKSPSPRCRVGGQEGHNSQATSVSAAASTSKKSPVRAQAQPLPPPPPPGPNKNTKKTHVSPPPSRPPSKASSQSSEVYYSAREDSWSPPQQIPPPPVQAATSSTSNSPAKSLTPQKNVPKSPPPPAPTPSPKSPPPPQVTPLSSSSTTSATTSNGTKLKASKKFPILTSVKYMPALVDPPPKIPRPFPSTSKSKSPTVNISQVSLQRLRGKQEPFMWHLCLLWSRKILELLKLNNDAVCKGQLLTKLNIGKMMSEVVTLKHDWPYMDWKEDFLMFEITEKTMTDDRAHNFKTLQVTEATHPLNEFVPSDDRKWSLKFELSTMVLAEEMVRLVPKIPTLVLIWGAKISGNREIQLRGGGGGEGQGPPRILIFRGEVPSSERMKIIQNIGKLGDSELEHLNGPKVNYKKMAHRNFQDDSLVIQLSRRSAAEIERVKEEERLAMRNGGFPRGCPKVTLIAKILPPEEDIYEILRRRPGQTQSYVPGQRQVFAPENPPAPESQPPRPPPPEVEDTQAEVEAVAMEEDNNDMEVVEVVPETRENSQDRGQRSTSVASNAVDLEALQRESAEVEKKKMSRVVANGFPEAADSDVVEVPLVATGSQAERSKVNHDHDYVSCSQREMMLSQEMELTDDEDQDQQGETSGGDQVDGEKRRATGNQSQSQGQAENEEDDSEEYRFTQLINEL